MRGSTGLLANAGLLLDFLRFRPRLKRLLSRIVEPQDIDDILQETFIRVCAAARTTQIVNARSFMFKTAQNLAFNHVSTAYYRRTQLEDFSAPGMELLSPKFESQFESGERFVAFCRAVRGLPTQSRRAFVLRKVYGLSQREIAEFLGISESTVEKHVAKGLLLTREALLRAGHLEAHHSASRIRHAKT